MEVPSFLGSKQVEEVDKGTHMLESSTLNRQFPFFVESKSKISFVNLLRISHLKWRTLDIGATIVIYLNLSMSYLASAVL